MGLLVCVFCVFCVCVCLCVFLYLCFFVCVKVTLSRRSGEVGGCVDWQMSYGLIMYASVCMRKVYMGV